MIGRVRIGSFQLGNVVGTLLAGVADRPARHPGRPDRQDRLLRPLPLRDRLQGRPAVHPRAGQERAAAGRADGRPLRHEPRDDGRRREDLRLRLRDGGGPDGRRLHRIDRHRHGGRRRSTRLDLPEAEKTRLLNNIPVAYAVSYLVGTGFVVWFLSSLAPRLLQGGPEGGEPEARGGARGRARRSSRASQSAYREWDVRAYRLATTALGGPDASPSSRSPSRPTASSSSGSAAAARSSTPSRTTVLARGRRRRGRRPAAACSRGRHRRSATRSRTATLLDFPVVALDVVLTNRSAGGPHARGARRGARPRRRPAQARPRRRGDPVRRPRPSSIAATCCGSPARTRDVERAGKALGYIERPSQRDRRRLRRPRHRRSAAWSGSCRSPSAACRSRLTASGGALIMGLVFGWLRSVRPTFGRIPEPALWVFDTDRPRRLHRRRRPERRARASSSGLQARPGRACSSSASSWPSRRTSRRSSSAATS